MENRVNFSLHIILIVLCTFIYEASGRSFSIDYANDTFSKDGKPFRYISGTMHFARTPHYYWRDRLSKMHAAGFNAVQTYIFWNFHEPHPGVYNFKGQHDFIKFIKLAQEYDLLVVLRVGPYICAEWDFGGIPAWILKDHPHVVVRTMDPAYIKPVDRWLDLILNMIKPMLYKNGGPIITAQVENEYGSYPACDYNYLRYLRHKFKSILGDDVVLFTTDGNTPGYLKCGTLEGLYATVDFGVTYDPKKAFAAQREWEPHGPLVNSEFYIGWIDHWNLNHSHVDAGVSAKSLDVLLAYGANINNYLFAGGSNFGFNSGANYPPFLPVTTSYDFDGILTEAGDITPKYHAVRKVISKYNKLPPGPIPPSTPKYAYGRVEMYYVDHVYNLLPKLCKHPVQAVYPLTMEKLEQYNGFVLYRHTARKSYQNQRLKVSGLRDRAYIAINENPHGVLEREGQTDLRLDSVKAGDYVNILVENQGYIEHGPGLVNNSKGILGNVTLGGDILTNWTMYPLSFDWSNPQLLWKLKQRNSGRSPLSRQHGDSLYTLPALFTGRVELPKDSRHPVDTYLDPRPFVKGQAFINTDNMGRYWPTAGPQVTLYVPKGVLETKSNYISVSLFELEYAPHATSHCALTDVAFINKTVPRVDKHSLHVMN